MDKQAQESSRQLLVRWMDEAWDGGLWAAPWKQALEGLSAQQASWRPAQDRKNIWELASHVCFWREHELRGLAGEKVSKDEVERRNFEAAPGDRGDAAWDVMRQRFADTHSKLRALIADERNDLARLQYLVPHDSYHVGQIMTLRALQGLAPIN